MQKEIIVAVSGGFDPLHVGHVEMFEKAKELGNKLVVILNNDNWLKLKKGFAFMPETERAGIIRALRCVDEVVLTGHASDSKDMSVCAELEKVKPDVFANGGDRFKDNVPEVEVCNRINCKMVFNLGSKIQSSSWLLAKYKEHVQNTES